MSVPNPDLPRWRQFLSPLRLSLLGINGICLGGCVVLLALGAVSVPLLLLTLATALCFGALMTGVIMASHRVIQPNDSTGKEDHEP